MQAIVLAVSAALAFAEKAMPLILELVKRGQVTPNEQQELRARYDALKGAGDGAFTGPEWEA